MLPVEGLVHQRDDGRAAATEQDRLDRHARGILPFGGDRRALRGGRREAGVRMGGRRLASRASTPCPASRSRAPAGSPRQPLPPHVAVVGERAVGEDRVLGDRVDRVRVGIAPVPGATPKKPASGLTAYSRPSAPNFIQAMSSPIVSTFQPGSVGISIARLVLPQALGKAAATYFDLPGRGQLQDQHVLGEPPLVTRHHRGDPQRKALLAEQRVAAVAGAVRQISGVSGKCTMYLFSALQGHGTSWTAVGQGHPDRVKARDEVAARHPARRAPPAPSGS